MSSMKKALFYILLLCSFSLYADILRDEEKKSFDYNNDSKIDLIEFYLNGILFKKERDENYDGVMDEKTEYFYHDDEKKPIEIVTQKNRIIKIYRNKQLKKIFKIIEIDKDGDGIYEYKYTDHTSIDQQNENCAGGDPQSILSNILNLSASVSNAVKKIIGNSESAYGHKIDSSCMINYPGQNFTKIVNDAISQGLICIEKLAKKNTAENPRGPNGALTNLVNLNRLMKNTPVTIVCNESEYKWDGVLGHASTKVSDTIKSLNVKHPFISLAPRDCEKDGEPKSDEILRLKGTIFHEQLHNLGFRHGTDIEYPYTCGQCCFSGSSISASEKESACKICRGQYAASAGVTKEYIVDMINWGKESYSSSKVEPIILSYMKENPNSKWGITAYATSSAGVFSAIGVELAKIVKERIPNLNSEEQKNINQAMSYEKSLNLKNISGNAKIVADGFYQFYYLGDGNKAIDFMKDNKDVLRKIRIDARSDAKISSNQRYTNEKIDEDTKKILMDLWFSTYPDFNKPVAVKAYKLLGELKYLD